VRKVSRESKDRPLAKVGSYYDNAAQLLAGLGAATAEEIKAECMYDQAYELAILAEENQGKNKEQREAFASQAAWKQRVQYEKARIERARAENSYKISMLKLRKIELFAGCIKSGVDLAEVFKDGI
jgi:hypothetical protein